MPVDQVREMHGLREIPVKRHYYVGFPDEPLTKAQEEENRVGRHDVILGEEYNGLQLELCCLLDDKIFVAESLNFVASEVTGVQGQNARTEMKPAGIAEGLPLSERKKIVKTRLRDARLAYQHDIETLRMLSGFLMTRTFSRPKDYPEPDTPEVLYRAFKGACHSRHSKDLGFRSSNQPLTFPSYHNGTLLDSSLVDEDALRTQCEGGKPSDLIALSDSPSRIFNITQGWDFEDMKGDMIAVINVSKLLRMGVLFNRTTTLAKSLDMALRTARQPGGVQYANPNYWVAYRWVPAECIEFYISLSFLRKACEIRGIGENDFGVNFSLEEILAFKVQNLSM
ncbi:hypothetical protein ASPSYDRAFT_94733 [Aspergillus sydowii CBS 593.65]|uniref:DUF7587 domain-containing protein n=1 Tax=Aspergillus sydowii CBS 593.65 TaxID=1036612 RepID=A0A1L9T2K6_9EURO|nr:uncharacterized protein ASPSYDRAFT_94733 [Aspergillus sydowii CBS 593.65]OJJ53533.1 hypothetical protein ASPSYDRAFT_94733 [Aspergillus sydowii CBS 593.65]